MLAVEANEIVSEGNSPAQVSPFQKQLKLPCSENKKPIILPRPKAWALESPHVDCSDSLETSEPPYSWFEHAVHKSVENDIERALTTTGGDSAVNGPSSIEHEHGANSDPVGHVGKPKNHKSRARLESNDRLLQLDSSSDPSCEFRQEVSKLKCQLDDASKNTYVNEDKVLKLPQLKDIPSDVLAPRSTYDNCPLSATSYPIHIDILKEKNDSKVVESMPRILPPQDVQSSNLDKMYQYILPCSSKYSEELQQPFLEGSIQSSMDDKRSHKEERNRTVQNTNQNRQHSFQYWLCCWRLLKNAEQAS